MKHSHPDDTTPYSTGSIPLLNMSQHWIVGTPLFQLVAWNLKACLAYATCSMNELQEDPSSGRILALPGESDIGQVTFVVSQNFHLLILNMRFLFNQVKHAKCDLSSTNYCGIAKYVMSVFTKLSQIKNWDISLGHSSSNCLVCLPPSDLSPFSVQLQAQWASEHLASSPGSGGLISASPVFQASSPGSSYSWPLRITRLSISGVSWNPEFSRLPTRPVLPLCLPGRITLSSSNYWNPHGKMMPFFKMSALWDHPLIENKSPGRHEEPREGGRGRDSPWQWPWRQTCLLLIYPQSFFA